MVWIIPGTTIKVEIEGLNFEFHPMKRKDRMALRHIKFADNPDSVDIIYDTVLKHIHKIDSIEDVKEFIETQPPNMVGQLFAQILYHGVITEKESENLNLPSESSSSVSPAEIVKPNVEKENVS